MKRKITDYEQFGLHNKRTLTNDLLCFVVLNSSVKASKLISNITIVNFIKYMNDVTLGHQYVGNYIKKLSTLLVEISDEDGDVKKWHPLFSEVSFNGDDIIFEFNKNLKQRICELKENLDSSELRVFFNMTPAVQRFYEFVVKNGYTPEFTLPLNEFRRITGTNHIYPALENLHARVIKTIIDQFMDVAQIEMTSKRFTLDVTQRIKNKVVNGFTFKLLPRMEQVDLFKKQ